MPLSQVRLPDGEGRLERKKEGRKEVKAKFHRPDKSYEHKNIYQGDEMGYDEEENSSRLNGSNFVKAAVTTNV